MEYYTEKFLTAKLSYYEGKEKMIKILQLTLIFKLINVLSHVFCLSPMILVFVPAFNRNFTQEKCNFQRKFS